MAEKLMKYADAVSRFDPVFGLETHVELSTTTKLFCPAHIEFGGEPNTQLTPVSLGLPGSLPVVGDVGATRTSAWAKAASKSRMMRVRTFWAEPYQAS